VFDHDRRLSETVQVVKVKSIFKLLKYKFNYCSYTRSPCQRTEMLEYQNTRGQCLKCSIPGFKRVHIGDVCNQSWRVTITGIHEAMHVSDSLEITEME
jgi:hypothetical protein